eukprot:TRINITY_DN9493_c0_g1_i2.p1 TRINITY_DN9493_c0_g1~~TRINITY_DN9493_c0_g1_i2.p1  ORF type:complete len:366 (-),score=79.88 TRINITY_DN9493_c0_g1_i2:10-1107(-)
MQRQSRLIYQETVKLHTSAITTTQHSKFSPQSAHESVLEQLQPLSLGSLFLGITLNVIVFVLFVLSVVLIYSLLMVSVDTKTFENGVLRVMGFTKRGLVELVLVQALSFTIPAIIIGLLLTLPVLSFVNNIFKTQIDLDIGIVPPTIGFIWSISVGILLPTISAIIPIRTALSKSLSDSLDTNRSKVQAVHVEVVSEANAIPWNRIVFGVVGVLFGISIYYLLPLSLLSFNFGLLLSIFLWIMIGMLVGFGLLALNVQHLLERLVVVVFLFFESKVMRALTLKNLIGHRLRNRKTSLMYSLSLGFIIFITVSYNTQLQSSSYSTLQRRGAYMTVYLIELNWNICCLLYTSPSPRDRQKSRMPSSA